MLEVFFKELSITNKKIMNFLFLGILNKPKEFANLYIYIKKLTINYEFTLITTYFNRKYQKQTKLYKKINKPS